MEKMEKLHQFIGILPKVELHAHINGSISEKTMLDLVALKRKEVPNWSLDDKWETSIQKGTSRTLQECFEIFALIHELCDKENVAYLVTKDVIEEFAKDNVKYLELRTTPRANGNTGMTKESYIKTVIKAIKEQNENPALDIIVRLLLSIDRSTTLDDAFDTIKLAHDVKNTYGEDILVGIDLSGDPRKGDASSFIPVLLEAKKIGFKLAIHLAEISNQNDETSLLLKIPPDRIGHGTFLHSEVGGRKEFVTFVQNNKIPIELCLTSNMKTKTVNEIDGHHFGYWYNKQHICTICTDDKGVFSTSLSEEFMLAAETFKLDASQIWDLSYSSIDYIFADQETKDHLKTKWNNMKSSLVK